MKALAKFEPQKTLAKNVGYDAAIKFAMQIRDWPALERAIEEKIEEQRDFVAWWDQHVGVRLQSGRGEMNADRRSLISRQQAEQQTKIKQQQVSRWRQRLMDINEYKSALFGKTYQAAMAETHGSNPIQQSLSSQHYTPAKYLEAARQVLGDIDLDPASCEEANQAVQAKKFYAKDGLAADWRGTVWLNPPYGGDAAEFIVKLHGEYLNGNVSAGIALVNAHCTDTKWFQLLWDFPICFTDHRINFYGDDERSGSTHGSAFVYLGPDCRKFADNFEQFGAVVRRYDDP